jgi:hypothetical protein
MLTQSQAPLRLFHVFLASPEDASFNYLPKFQSPFSDQGKVLLLTDLLPSFCCLSSSKFFLPRACLLKADSLLLFSCSFKFKTN